MTGATGGVGGMETDGLKLPQLVASATGASALTCLAAGAAGVKHRIYRLIIGSDTAGKVVMSDSVGSYYCPANGTVTIDFGLTGGVKQGTAATAITATLAGADLSVVMIYSLDA
jgi:hypothetical protein